MSKEFNNRIYDQKQREFNNIIKKGNSFLYKSIIYFIRIFSFSGVLFCLTLSFILFFHKTSKVAIYKEVAAIKKLVTRPEKFEKYTILIAGKDKDRRAARSDTLMVAFVDSSTKKVNIVSIPRDTRVHIRNHASKINSAFRRGGIDLTKEIVRDYLGIKIDKYLCVDVDGFVKCIDIIGGIEVDVKCDMKYTDKAQDLYINIKKGKQVLNGMNSMHYVRYREKLYGDIGRIKRQQKFMKLLSKKMKKFSTIWKIPEILSQIYNNIDTDFTVSELLSLASKFRGVKKSDVTFLTLPGKPGYFGKVSYFLANPKKVNILISKLYGKETKPLKLFEVAKINRKDKVVSLKINGKETVHSTKEIKLSKITKKVLPKTKEINSTKEISIIKPKKKDITKSIKKDDLLKQNNLKIKDNKINKKEKKQNNIESKINKIKKDNKKIKFKNNEINEQDNLIIDLTTSDSTEEIILMR